MLGSCHPYREQDVTMSVYNMCTYVSVFERSIMRADSEVRVAPLLQLPVLVSSHKEQNYVEGWVH